MSIPFYFDIETIPDQAENAFQRHLEAVKPPANYKKPETIAKWMAENAEAAALEDYRKTALTGLYGEICSIAWAIDDGEIRHITRDENVSEFSLLVAFWDKIYSQIREEQAADETRATWAKLEWIGHNVIDFDLRFLLQRHFVNKVRTVFTIPADSRHGHGVFDTMKEWGGWRGYVKQSELVKALHLEPPTWAEGLEDVDGSHVFDLWKAKDYDTIARYNKLDVHWVREIHKRMIFV